ncbi:uncharacterized protein LOC130659960 [Hydractinia symbiolongicarpus]|uniref:uncharacterized protein LOC130659960 n=1 Tax=Hydractinia symbiolongicarpus TaxID=13093 RepID=UPI00254A5547|nr:uncharacterized protein LOC130659960 [Hydractinia symbiolongicarpus]
MVSDLKEYVSYEVETNEWNEVKKGPSGKIEKRYNNRFSLSNRFSTLQNEQNNNNHYDAQPLTNNQSYAPPQPNKSIRRPNPVINRSPERDLLKRNIKSSETRKNKKKIRIISDSIAKGINTREFNNHLRNGDARFKVFPGSNIKNLGHYSLPTLVDENQEIVVVHVGINDLLDIKRNKSSVNEIAEKFNLRHPAPRVEIFVKFAPDYFVLSETKLDSTFPNSHFTIDDNELRSRKDRDKNGGGLIESNRKFDKRKFLSDVRNTRFDFNKNDPASNYDHLTKTFSSIIEKHAPLKQKLLRGNEAPFMNKELRQAIYTSELAELFNEHYINIVEKSRDKIPPKFVKLAITHLQMRKKISLMKDKEFIKSSSLDVILKNLHKHIGIEVTSENKYSPVKLKHSNQNFADLKHKLDQQTDLTGRHKQVYS